jgi:ribonuclease Z
MKPVFHLKLINGYFDDPCLSVRIVHEKRGILFDLGVLNALGTSDFYKISDVFVTHTHMDHFIGFDTLLRAVLRRESPLNVYGPPSILPCVQGKLKGYTWNLIEDYPIEINVFAYDGRKVIHALFAAKSRFRKEIISIESSDGMLLQEPLFTIRAAKMDHGIPCLAFSMEENFHININKALLTASGFSVGPWLNEFKRILREHPGEMERQIFVGGRKFRIQELSDLAKITTGQKISYASDIGPHKKNIARLIPLIQGSDIFFCEAYFLNKDYQRAAERFHLTAKNAGAIAREAGVKKLALMHFSPKYRDCPDAIIEEAMKEFNLR